MKKIIMIAGCIFMFFMTMIFPPLAITVVTWLLFPRMAMSFPQLFWLIGIGWLAVNYIIITIQKSVEEMIDNKK